MAERAIPEGFARLRRYIRDLKVLEAEWARELKKKQKERDNRRAEFRAMHRRGLTYAAIGELQGMTRQRVEQIINGDRRYEK